MAMIIRWIGQAIIYAGMALWLGHFANRPVYTHLPPDQALIKLAGSGDKRVEALRIADIFRARVVDAGHDHFIFEMTGRTDKLDAFIELMRPLGLVDVSRTTFLNNFNVTNVAVLFSIPSTFHRTPLTIALPDVRFLSSPLSGNANSSRSRSISISIRFTIRSSSYSSTVRSARTTAEALVTIRTPSSSIDTLRSSANCVINIGAAALSNSSSKRLMRRQPPWALPCQWLAPSASEAVH